MKNLPVKQSKQGKTKVDGVHSNEEKINKGARKEDSKIRTKLTAKKVKEATLTKKEIENAQKNVTVVRCEEDEDTFLMEVDANEDNQFNSETDGESDTITF